MGRGERRPFFAAISFPNIRKKPRRNCTRQMIRYTPHLLIAGPAFESGRYGVACGAICKAAQERLGIYAVAGMDQENAGAALYCKNAYIINSGDSIVRMVPTLQ